MVQEIMPAYVGVDFEWNFSNQVANHLSDAELISCLFHFKQTIRRKMILMGIPEAGVKFTIRQGVVNLITVIPHDELNKGVAFNRTQIITIFVELYEDKSMTSLKLHPVIFGTSFETFILPVSVLFFLPIICSSCRNIIGFHLFMFHINILLLDNSCGSSWSKFGTCRDWIR